MPRVLGCCCVWDAKNICYIIVFVIMFFSYELYMYITLCDFCCILNVLQSICHIEDDIAYSNSLSVLCLMYVFVFYICSMAQQEKGRTPSWGEHP